MSGIYIPDMEIPKDGYRQLFLTAEGEIIWFLSSPQDGDIRRVVIPVPDHGDLIERDKIGLTDFEIILCQKGNQFKNALEMLFEKIEKMPTIIPSDKKEQT